MHFMHQGTQRSESPSQELELRFVFGSWVRAADDALMTIREGVQPASPLMRPDDDILFLPTVRLAESSKRCYQFRDRCLDSSNVTVWHKLRVNRNL